MYDLGAVQSQDYAAAKWGVGQRTVGITDAIVEQAFADGSILRTHVMRPTWHFVTPSDIRWMLSLTAPRVHAANAYRYRELELNEAVFRRCRSSLMRALQGGRQLTRTELRQLLQRARIDTTAPQRLAYLLMHAELEGVICSGARRGKQFTYALLDERVPPASVPQRDEALHDLTMRYFSTRGPATPQDFSWWSGLTVADAKRGVEAAGTSIDQLERHHQAHERCLLLPPLRLYRRRPLRRLERQPHVVGRHEAHDLEQIVGVEADV